ncbi:MAG TPA: cation-transporting P-type ATPase, partial [Aquabacterium sp.]|nr:cation-transporting P-type ATPase [Aquabacterium sp.]
MSSTPHDIQAASRKALIDLATQPIEAGLRGLDSTAAGLTAEQAAARLAAVGRNEVVTDTRRGLIRQVLDRLRNPLNLLLLCLAGVSLLTGNLESAVIITLMVVLSMTLALVQERRSGQAATALRALVHTTATVLRQGHLQEVPMAELVPGDIVHLSAGDLVPADVRLLTGRDFFVNEAALTGESLPAEKYPLTESPEVEPLALRNICYMGTHVASGIATAVVVHTGARAVFGGIALAMTEVRVQTSFEQGINRFIGLMLRFMAVMVPLVFLINGL